MEPARPAPASGAIVAEKALSGAVPPLRHSAMGAGAPLFAHLKSWIDLNYH
jgi:hypothetical protein